MYVFHRKQIVSGFRGVLRMIGLPDPDGCNRQGSLGFSVMNNDPLSAFDRGSLDAFVAFHDDRAGSEVSAKHDGSLFLAEGPGFSTQFQ